VTDSTCDIPEDLVAQYEIRIVPQYIIWGEEQFLDRMELSPQAFYERLQFDSQKPTSSQATVIDFTEAINKVVEDGADEVVILTVSSAMSGTYRMAKSAAEKAQIPVSVIDSKGPTMSLGWQVLAAVRACDQGASMAEIVDQVAKVRENLVQIVAMETLEYLAYGGRIGDAAKWVGTLMKVKPVVMINHETGRVEPAGLARTHKAMIKMLEKKFFDAAGTGKTLHIAVLHGNALDEAERLAEQIREEYEPAELLINITGPVLGINTGPGALALCGYAEG
jgi:DegV family protein with EDD domain